MSPPLGEHLIALANRLASETQKAKTARSQPQKLDGAGKEIRTLDPLVGNEMLYH